jgi:hypothetical protein
MDLGEWGRLLKDGFIVNASQAEKGEGERE